MVQIHESEIGTLYDEAVVFSESQEGRVSSMLIVDDDSSMREIHEIMSGIFMPEAAQNIVIVGSAQEAAREMAKRATPFDVVLADRILGGEEDGFFVAAQAKLLSPHSTVIMHTAQPEEVTDIFTQKDLRDRNIAAVIGKMVEPFELYSQVRQVHRKRIMSLPTGGVTLH